MQFLPLPLRGQLLCSISCEAHIQNVGLSGSYEPKSQTATGLRDCLYYNKLNVCRNSHANSAHIRSFLNH